MAVCRSRFSKAAAPSFDANFALSSEPLAALLPLPLFAPIFFPLASSAMPCNRSSSSSSIAPHLRGQEALSSMFSLRLIRANIFLCIQTNGRFRQLLPTIMESTQDLSQGGGRDGGGSVRQRAASTVQRAFRRFINVRIYKYVGVCTCGWVSVMVLPQTENSSTCMRLPIDHQAVHACLPVNDIATYG